MSLHIVPVPIEHIGAAWPRLEPYLAAGLEHADGELTAEQLRHLALQGHAALVACWRDAELAGAAAFELVRYPQFTVAQVIAWGGEGLFADEHGMAQVRDFCRRLGASRMQALCRPAVTRYARRFGFAPVYDLIRSTL